MTTLQLVYDWFYAPKSARVVALYRIALGIVVLLTALLYRTHVVEFFSNHGYVSKEFVHQTSSPHGFSLLFWYDAVWFAQLCYWVLILSCAMFIFGLWSRLTGFLTYILFLSIYNRFPLIDFDGTVVMIIALFFTIFLQTDKALVPKWYARKYGTAETVPGWPARLIELQMIMIYFFAGLTKFRGQTWLMGTEMGGIIHWQYVTGNFSFIDGHPLLINLLTYGPMFAELSFAFWIWFKPTRRWVWLAVFAMHIGIGLTMQVTYFSEAMIACLIIFMNEQDLKDIAKAYAMIVKGFNRFKRRREIETKPA